MADGMEDSTISETDGLAPGSEPTLEGIEALDGDHREGQRAELAAHRLLK
jgi:hypothetical protein